MQDWVLQVITSGLRRNEDGRNLREECVKDELHKVTAATTAGFLARSWAHKVHTSRNPIHAHMEIGEFGVGRPDFGGRRPSGEALSQKIKKGSP